MSNVSAIIGRNGPVKKPTLKDVAQAAGVSEMTASRALRKAGDVSEATRQKIRTVAAGLGYVPNRIAGSLASRSVDLVGVVVPSLSSFVFPELLAGVSSKLTDSDLQPVIGVTNYNMDEEHRVVREMMSWRPKGLIIAGLEHSAATIKLLKAADIPIVEVMDIDGDPIDFCVGISHIVAGRRAAEAIIERGYKNIGFIGTKMPFDFRAGKRLKGFTACLQANNISLLKQELYDGTSSIAKGRALTASMLTSNPSIDCIYYSSDVMSVGGLMHCLATGLSVPGDLALAGFNNLEMLSGLPVQLASTNSFRFEIGQAAADIVVSGPKDEDSASSKIIAFDPVVLPGQSL
jgi:LacI family gluconate utilization system Gnt-I transcriptional repressor